MNKEEIQKAFEGRWRLKCDYGKLNTNSERMSFDEFYEYLRGLCLDFFEAGVLLGEGFRTSEITFPDGEKGTITWKRELDTDTMDGGFNIFWNLYEKKVGRPKCEKLWSKLTLKEKEECLAYIPLYKQAQSDKQFRKNPETFLRNKSWNDELIYRNNTEQQRQQRLAEVAERIAGYTKTAK